MEVSPLGAPNRHSLGKPLPYQQADGAQAFSLASCDFSIAATLRIIPPFDGLCSTKGKFLGITHPFAVGLNPLDLHVLGTPPAFILSQDQTLKVKPCPPVRADARVRSHTLHTEVKSVTGELAKVIL